MANAATVAASTSSAPGPVWMEFTNAANIALNASGTNSGATVFTVGLPTAGAGSLFLSTLPLAITVLNQANIQGGQNSGMTTGAGIANVVWTNSTTLTITAVNAGAAGNIVANTRFLLIQNQGV